MTNVQSAARQDTPDTRHKACLWLQPRLLEPLAASRSGTMQGAHHYSDLVGVLSGMSGQERNESGPDRDGPGRGRVTRHLSPSVRR